MAKEYCVRWQRQGIQKRREIFQTEKAALDKRDRLISIEETKGYEGEFGERYLLADLPDLTMTPIIECREVGVWQSRDD